MRKTSLLVLRQTANHPRWRPVSGAEEETTGASCHLKADCLACKQDHTNKTSAEVCPALDGLHLDNKDHQVLTAPPASPATSDDEDERFSLPPPEEADKKSLPADTAADKDLVPAPCALCTSGECTEPGCKYCVKLKACEEDLVRNVLLPAEKEAGTELLAREQ